MSTFTKIQEAITVWVGKIQWKQKKHLSVDELAKFKDLLSKDYYVILTRRQNHLSSFFIGVSHLFATGKWGFWSHVLANLEDEVHNVGDFRLVEAIGSGVQYSPFNTVFDCDSAVLLKPKGVDIKEWTLAMDSFKESIGLPYDTLFDIKDKSRVSCVELIYAAMLHIPGYNEKFKAFDELVRKKKYLTPQMFIDSGCFDVVYMVKHSGGNKYTVEALPNDG